jgi:F-type H+-transporting ATPase subunit epsilon
METIKLEILTPNGAICNCHVTSVTLPGSEGEFGVLPHHASVTTLLSPGVIDIEFEDKPTESIVVNWGVVQVDEEKVVVLVDGAVAIRGESDSDIARALDNAKRLLQEASDSNFAIAAVSAKLESAASRLL